MIFLLLLLQVIHSRRILEEAAIHNPSNWTQTQRADPSSSFNLIIALRQNNVHILENLFNKLSDPSHPFYGQYLNQNAVHSLLQPSISSLSAVTDWLESVGINSYFLPTNDFLQANVTIEQAENLLKRKYYVYEHPEGGKALRLSSPHYTVPTSVAPHIDFVSPTIRFPPIQQAQRHIQSWVPSSPSNIRKLYNVGNSVGTNKDNRQAVTAFLEQYFSVDDQNLFYDSQFQTASGQQITLKGDPEAVTGVSAGIEAMIDTEYIIVTGAGVPTEFWAFAGRAPDNSENEPFLKWLIEVSKTPDNIVPKLFSTSYGEEENTVTEQYAARINVEFQKAGVRGISLLFASGDSGAAGDDGCDGPQQNDFVPQFPAASPFVTAVGGTTAHRSSAAGDILSEKAARLSSGGFSNRYDRPWWQKHLVDDWFKNSHVPLKQIVNPQGRAFPDVSALATGYTVVANGGSFPQVAGTSCSCPVVGGIISLLNDIRLNAGKPPLGFLNPFLYQNPQAFNDIVDGFSAGCTYTSEGFAAEKGWDPATGLGTPDFEKLADAVRLLK